MKTVSKKGPLSRQSFSKFPMISIGTNNHILLLFAYDPAQQ